MAKEKTAVANSFFQELFHAGVYKRSQGKVTRQLTFAALAVAVGLLVWKIYSYLSYVDSVAAETDGWLESIVGWLFQRIGESTVVYGLPLLVLAAGLWISYRMVNITRFADFLIAVEAEMNKVTWPSRTELVRSSLVVIFVIVFMAILLFGYDFFWRGLFTWMGVL
jgi:preprotein translocase subunit SecE